LRERKLLTLSNKNGRNFDWFFQPSVDVYVKIVNIQELPESFESVVVETSLLSQLSILDYL